MSKDKTIDMNTPEMRLRYQNCLLAVEAMESIFAMLKKNPPDTMFVLGSIMGETLYRYVKKDEVQDTLKKLCEQAMDVYSHNETTNMLGNVNEDTKH